MITIVFALLIYPNLSAQQQDELVETLDIQGNRRLTDVEILTHMKTRPGERFDEKQIQDDLQSLLKLGVFDTTNTKVLTETGMRGGVNVIFEVQELPLIAKLKFNGLRYLTEQEILAELREQKVEVKAGEPYRPQKMRKANRVITEYLVKRGFSVGKVSITEESLSATTLILTFVIDELPDDDEDYQ